MRTNLAVMLDELVEQGGELQVKRERANIGSTWELILWLPPASQRRWKTKLIALQATTSLELVDQLEERLEKLANPDPEPEPASAPLRVGQQMALPVV